MHTTREISTELCTGQFGSTTPFRRVMHTINSPYDYGRHIEATAYGRTPTTEPFSSERRFSPSRPRARGDAPAGGLAGHADGHRHRRGDR